jgi:hypothetical protein
MNQRLSCSSLGAVVAQVALVQPALPAHQVALVVVQPALLVRPALMAGVQPALPAHQAAQAAVVQLALVVLPAL